MNAEERHQARVSILAAHIVNPMPWVFHEGSLWNETTKAWLEAADAGDPGEVADDDWPSTIHGSDFEPALGAFIAEASVGYPAALDDIEKLAVALRRIRTRHYQTGARRCRGCDVPFPCATAYEIDELLTRMELAS